MPRYQSNAKTKYRVSVLSNASEILALYGAAEPL